MEKLELYRGRGVKFFLTRRPLYANQCTTNREKKVRHFSSYFTQNSTIETRRVEDQIPSFKIQKFELLAEILDVEGVILNSK